MFLHRFAWHRVPPLIRIVIIVMLWRLTLSLCAGLSLWYNPLLYPYGKLLSWNGRIQEPGDILYRALLERWTIWDGEYYTAIALHGYTFRDVTWPSIPFFPLYPFLVRLSLPIFAGNVVLAAILVANLALVLALVVLHNLVQHDFGEVLAERTIVLLLLFPTSMFFTAGYTESLALLLTVSVVWALQRQQWWLAGSAGFFLALTRLPGVLTALIILLVYLDHLSWRWRSIRLEVLAAGLPVVGLGLFTLYQWRRFGTPLAFLIAQGQWEQSLSPPWIIPQTLVTRLQLEALPIYGLHLTVWGLFIVLAVSAWRRLPRLYGFVLLLLVPAYLGSWAFSIGRHVLIGFPIFIVLAMWSEVPWVRWLLITLMFPLLLVCTALFVNTFWIG